MATLTSLDPRVTRLGIPESNDEPQPKEALDQFETYEVFVQPKEGKPYEHVGVVHAPDVDLAFMFGKEQFSRRFTCVGLAVASTRDIKITEVTENKQSIYATIEEAEHEGTGDRYEVFHLMKRGKQVKHMGSVTAQDYQEALKQAKRAYHDDKPVYNIWLVKSEAIKFVDVADRDLWNTLGDKLYRDALAYKAGDKLKDFKKARAAKA